MIKIAKKYEITTNEKHNRLTILEEIEPRYTSGGNKKRMIKVQCECGTIKDTMLTEVINGKIKSCGCYNREKAGKNLITHNLSGTRLYRIWKDMRRRCNNPNRNNYIHYGARGITYSEEWDDYKVFHEWAMSNGYDDALSIDRINHNGNYEPSNCRWIPISEQNSNTCRQKPFKAISPDGIEYTSRVIKDFAKEHNLHRAGISDCLNGRYSHHRGWKFERLNENN